MNGKHLVCAVISVVLLSVVFTPISHAQCNQNAELWGKKAWIDPPPVVSLLSTPDAKLLSSVKNTGTDPVHVKVVFKLWDEFGALYCVTETPTVEIPVNPIPANPVKLPPVFCPLADFLIDTRVHVEANIVYDTNCDTIPDTVGPFTATFHFDVKP